MDQLPDPPRGPSSIVRKKDRVPPELEEVSAYLARIDNPFEWTSDDPEPLEKLAWAAMLSWDGDEETRVAEILPILYGEFSKIHPIEARRRFLDEIWHLVVREEAHVQCLWQIAFLENDPAIVAAAIKAFVFVYASSGSDPAEIAKGLLDEIEGTLEVTRAGVFHGLMILGDEFVLDELWARRWELTDEEVSIVCNVTMVEPSLNTILFLLAWLEEAQEHHDHSRFRSIEWALTPSPDVENETEDKHEEWAITTEPDLLVAGDGFMLDPPDLARQIEPRLRALAEHKTGPRVTDSWIEGWGLVPGSETS